MPGPSCPMIQRTPTVRREGFSAMLPKHWAAGLLALSSAVALAQPSPLLELHLGKALVKTGDTARGRALIQKAIDSKVNLPRLDEARALLAQG